MSRRSVGGRAPRLGAAAIALSALAAPGAAAQDYRLPPPPPRTVPPPAPPRPPPSPPAPRTDERLSPFPVVRIVTSPLPGGVRVTRLTVRARVGVRVVARCAGGRGSCPYATRATRIGGPAGAVRTIRVRALERAFPAGTVLRVYVVDAARVGKLTSLRVGRGAPRRADRCVRGISLRPVRCPPGAALPRLDPFPVVRIVGRTTRDGARITLLTVRARVGATVISRCVGGPRMCPYRQRRSRIPGRVGAVRSVRVRGFERAFRAGVLLRVMVVARGRTGKAVTLRVRRSAPPRRSDRCTAGLAPVPVACP